MTLIILLALGFALAYVNGANDVSKGIATLVGGGVTNFRRAIAWGTFWTGVGGIASAFLSRAMIQTFGSGLLAPGIHASEAAALATIIGAALWVALATMGGLPVSTTHAIVGSIAGTTALAYGVGGVNWVSLGGKIALPLLLSPIVSLILTSTLLRVWSMSTAGTVNDCLCAELVQPFQAMAGSDGIVLPSPLMPGVQVATCIASEATSPRITLNHLHWLTSGAASFARGLNDVPKMVALLLSAALLSGTVSAIPVAYFAGIALGMVCGSWMAGQRITEVLACEVTPMDHREGFVANLTTAALVGVGAALGWPMSTTHVASGAILGIASTRKEGGNEPANYRTIRAMLVAWVVTLPVAALLGATALVLLRLTGVH